MTAPPHPSEKQNLQEFLIDVLDRLDALIYDEAKMVREQEENCGETLSYLVELKQVIDEYYSQLQVEKMSGKKESAKT